MEVDSEGNILARYVYGLGFGREDASGHYLSYHSDMRGSTTLLTDETGRVTDRYIYGIYGELEQHEGTTYQPFCYNGRDGVMTDANGLYYMRARYYDPKLKRLLNWDIIRGDIADGQTFNRYAYVNGDPVSYIDPLGLFKSETKGTGNVQSINPNDIRFSQNKVNDAKEIIESMKVNGWAGSPIEVVRMPDGKLTTIDNTRVLSAKYANIDVKAIVHDSNAPLPSNYIDRFTTKKGVPITWEDAINLRIGKQGASYKNKYPYGSNITGWDGN